jgi:adenylate cyclase class 2
MFLYEKYRTEYISTIEPGTVTLDETPIGTFLELEGPPDWIDATARRLNFTEADYIVESYGKLYSDYCIKHGLAPADMRYEN